MNVNRKLIAIGTGSVLAVAVVAGGAITLNPTFGTSASAAPSVLSLLQQTAPQGGATASERAAQQQAYLQRLADNLGISVDTLTAALKTTSLQELDARVADGTITQTMADQIRARIEGGDVIFGLGGRGGPGERGRGGPGFGAGADELATFLGVDEATLGQQLRSGTTLAQAAAAAGKTRDELKAFITSQTKAALDSKVAEGDLTQAEADARLAKATANLDATIDSTGPAPHGPRTGPDAD